MLTMNDLNPLLRRRTTVVTGEGEKVGTMGVVYLNDDGEEPTWVTVHTGLFGTRESFVPLKDASVQGHDLVVRYVRDLIRHAPSVDRDGHLSPEEEAALYRHYGFRAVAPPRDSPRSGAEAVAASPAQPAVASTAVTASSGPAGSASTAAARPTSTPVSASTVAQPVSEPIAAATVVTADSAPAVEPPSPRTEPAVRQADGRSAASSLTAVDTSPSSRTVDVEETFQGGVHTHDDGGTPWVVRSEERLRVGTEQYDAGRVRLRKYVVTEEETVRVPLVAEEVRVVVEPITSSTAVDLGVPFQEESVELVAREEVALVGKETVAVERVRMRKVEVTGRATVREEVRKERIAVTVDGDPAKDADTSGRMSAGRRKSGVRGVGTGTKADASSKTAPTAVPKTMNALVKGKKKRR